MSAVPPSRWKRWIRRFLVVLLVGPFLLLALVNALLATPWAREYIRRKLSARLGVETLVGRVSCTPWGGLSVRDFRCLQPTPLRESVSAPLLEIREIRVHPQWSRLVRGDPAISFVRLNRPRLTLSLEMAASMVSAGAATPAPAGLSVPLQPPVASADASAVEKSSPPQAGAPPTAASPPSAPIPDSSTIGTAWIEVVDGEGEFWFSGNRVASFRGGEGKIPFEGAPAFSRLQLREMELFGHVRGRDLSLPLSWRVPELRCNPTEIQMEDLQLKVFAAVGALPGIPFAVEIVVPRQAARGDQWLEHMKPAAAQFEARLQGLGLMRHPSTWQGLATSAAESVTMQLGDQVIVFDEGRATVALQGGVLQCPDIRLTGESASFLGNGQLRADGQGTGVLRVVAPPDTADAWTQRLTIGDRTPVFAPLETPDRMFIDLRWISYSGRQGIEVGAGGPIVPAEELLKLLSGH